MAEHAAENDAPPTPSCASLGCERPGFIKSEQWGARLCPTHALTGPIGKNERHPCPTSECPGDGRYAAPGRGHIEGCTFPLPPEGGDQR